MTVADDRAQDTRAAAAPGDAPRWVRRFAPPFLLGCVVATILLGIGGYTLRRPIGAFAAERLVRSTLDDYATTSQLAAIEAEFERVSGWYASGRLPTHLFVRAVQTTLESPVVVHRFAAELSGGLAEFDGVREADADAVARALGRAIAAGNLSHAMLRDALGAAAGSARDPEAAAQLFFYGETTTLRDPAALSAAEQAEAFDRLRALAAEVSQNTTPIGPDIGTWLRDRYDAEIGWAVND